MPIYEKLGVLGPDGPIRRLGQGVRRDSLKGSTVSIPPIFYQIYPGVQPLPM
jgi:hypothetical protein